MVLAGVLASPVWARVNPYDPGQIQGNSPPTVGQPPVGTTKTPAIGGGGSGRSAEKSSDDKKGSADVGSPSATQDAEDESVPPLVLGQAIRLPAALGSGNKDAFILVQPPEGWTSVGRDGAVDRQVADFEKQELVPGNHNTRPEVTFAGRHAPAEESGFRLTIVCATAPIAILTKQDNSEDPGEIESKVYQGLDIIAQEVLNKPLKLNVGTFNAGEIKHTEHMFSRSFDMKTTTQTSARAQFSGSGVHLIAMTKNPKRILVCSSMCLEPDNSAGICSSVIQSIRPVGNDIDSMPSEFQMKMGQKFGAIVGLAIGILIILLGILAVIRGLTLPTPPAAK